MRFPAIRNLVFVAAAIAAAALNGVAKERPWHKVVTPNFTILTPGDEKVALQWASDFSQFVSGLQTFVTVNPKDLPNLTIVVFARESDFAAYRPLDSKGKPEDVAGFFSRRDSWAVAGLAGPSLSPETRRKVFHEGTHWFLSAAELPNPVWLDEGLAEVFSTFELHDKQVEWGRPIRDHVLVLETTTNLPLEKVLLLAHGDLFGEGSEAEERTGLAYAQSWLFVHYLMFGQRDVPKHALVDYARLLRVKSPDDAFQKAFGQSYHEVEIKLQDYLQNGKYYVAKVPLAALPPLTAEVAPPSDVDRVLGRLALVSGHRDEARKRALALTTREPQSPLGYELLGEVCEETDDSTGAVAAYRQAVERKSADYRPYFEVAAAKHKAAAGSDGTVRGMSNADARELADNYLQAVELNPRFEPAYESFAGTIPALDRPTDHDKAVLAQGHLLFPKAGSMRVALAVLDYRDGRKDEARRALTALIADSAPEAARVRKYAQSVMDTWGRNEIMEEVNRLNAAGKYAESLALVDAHLDDTGDLEYRLQLQQVRKGVEPAAKMQAINAATQSGQWQEARRLLQAFLESDAPAIMKNQARSLLARMDQRGLGMAAASAAESP